MGSKEEILQDICRIASQQVAQLYPSLTLKFVPHASGAFREIVQSHEHVLERHPAGQTAQHILEKFQTRDQSSFLGLACHHQIKWFGLASSDSVLGIININLDEFTSARQFRQTIYHLIWHAMDLMDVRQKKEYAAKFREGPMIPKRSPMNMARLTLQSDIFSVIMCGLMGDERTLEELGDKRADDSINQINARRAEDYPFVIALEPLRYAYTSLLAMKPAKQKFMKLARQATLEVARSFDEKHIRQWWAFAEPAQDMAWRHIAPDYILGCAVYTSEDPFVRATAHLIGGVCGIDPVDVLKSAPHYNSFAKKEQNKLLHREIAEKTFEEAVTKGMKEESGQSLISAANEQNEGLSEGIILGWCANALQAASRAFDTALTTGMSPAQAARMEFLGTKDNPPWETLKRVSDEIVEQRRKGHGVTLGQIADFAEGEADFSPVIASIKATMADPSYLQKLETANVLSVRPSAPAPQGPAPKTPAPVIPAYAMAGPSAPGLGGGSGQRRRTVERKISDRTDEQTSTENS